VHRVGVIGESLCLLIPSVSSDIGGFSEFGKFGDDNQLYFHLLSAKTWVYVGYDLKEG